MPITIKPTIVKYKDPTSDTYKSVDVIGETLTFDAEAYGIGKRNGINVGSTDVAYHNNSKYYMEQAQASAQVAATAAAKFSITVDNNHGLVFH